MRNRYKSNSVGPEHDISGTEQSTEMVLGLARMEVTFPIVDQVVLSWLSITHQDFGS